MPAVTVNDLEASVVDVSPSRFANTNWFPFVSAR